VPATVLVDDQIQLRALTIDDVDEWLAGEDPEQIRWFELDGRATRESVVRAIESWAESWRTSGPVRQWAVCDRGTSRIMGGVGVRDLGQGEVNLSYSVFAPFRRAGVATRASRLALKYAADAMGATVAVIKILDGNHISEGVARRLGAVAAGTAESDAGGTYIVFRLALGNELPAK